MVKCVLRCRVKRSRTPKGRLGRLTAAGLFTVLLGLCTWTVPSGAEETAANASASLETLEERLRDSDAIGIMDKMDLSARVDGLIGEFLLFHDGKSKADPDQLEERFHRLVFEAAWLVRDGDPELSKDLVAARPALWGLLNDPEKLRAHHDRVQEAELTVDR